MMEEKEKLCCYCERPLKDGDTHTCAQCGALYHQACWEEHGGCSNPACSPERSEQEQTPAVCPQCGAPWNEADKFCAKCGMSKDASVPLICPSCGEQLRQGQIFCAKCGCKAQQKSFTGVSPAQSPAHKKSKTPMIFAIMLSVLLLFGAVGGFFAYQVVQIHSYKTNAKEFYTTAISAGAKLENVGNDIHKNWNDST